MPLRMNDDDAMETAKRFEQYADELEQEAREIRFKAEILRKGVEYAAKSAPRKRA